MEHERAFCHGPGTGSFSILADTCLYSFSLGSLLTTVSLSSFPSFPILREIKAAISRCIPTRLAAPRIVRARNFVTRRNDGGREKM